MNPTVVKTHLADHDRGGTVIPAGAHRWRLDLSWDVRRRCRIAAQQRGGVRQPAGRQLHSIAGVPREANY
jgi:hypothetical protein